MASDGKLQFEKKDFGVLLQGIENDDLVLMILDEFVGCVYGEAEFAQLVRAKKELLTGSTSSVTFDDIVFATYIVYQNWDDWMKIVEVMVTGELGMTGLKKGGNQEAINKNDYALYKMKLRPLLDNKSKVQELNKKFYELQDSRVADKKRKNPTQEVDESLYLQQVDLGVEFGIQYTQPSEKRQNTFDSSEVGDREKV